MSTQAGIIGTGIIVRVLVIAFFLNDDKVAGTLLGILDGFTAHYAWRTDQLLEPLVLIDVILGTCFDAIFQVSTEKLVALALGGGIGILVADTLPSIWEDYGESKLGISSVEIKEDYDATDALTEFSEDVTYIYEEYTISRPLTTAAWIASQRKRRSEKSTSMAPTGISSSAGRNLLTSTIDTPTRLSRLSTKAHRDDDPLLVATELTATPSPAPSVSKSINIDIHPPSVASKSSVSTVKAKGTAHGTSPEIIETSIRAGSRQGSRHSAWISTVSSSSSSSKSSKSTSTSHTPTRPNINKVDNPAQNVTPSRGMMESSFPEILTPPNIPQSVGGRSSLHTLSHSHTRSQSRSRSRSRSRVSRSVAASAIRSPYVQRSRSQTYGSERLARSSSRLAHENRDNLKTPIGGTYLHASPIRSTRAVSPNREVIINYTDDATQIIIPPPSPSPIKEPGFNVKIIPNANEINMDVQPIEPENQDSLGLRGVVIDATMTPQRSQASFPELSTVPPEEERRSEGTLHRSSHGHTSSEPRAPSVFKLKTAWRDTTTPPSPSVDSYAGRSGKPFPIHDGEDIAQTYDFEIAKSTASVNNDGGGSDNSNHPLLVREHRFSMNSAFTSSRGRRGINTLDMDYDNENLLGEAKSPSIEFYHPNGSGSGVVVDDRDERTTSSHRYPNVRGRTRSRSLNTTSTIPESAISRERTAAIIIEAQELRKQAREEEARIKDLQQERKEAQERGQHTFAFKLGHEIENSKEKVRSLYRKAEKRLYLAHNAGHESNKINVHGLHVLEAVRRTEKQLYAVQERGGSSLQVILAGGKHSLKNVPVLKSAIIDRMEKKHHLHVTEDESNPALLHIFLP